MTAPARRETISHLEESIDTLHGKLASIDRKIGEWARRNLAKVTLETEEIDPQDAAREVVENAAQFEWIPDALGIKSRVRTAVLGRGYHSTAGGTGALWVKTLITSMHPCRNSSSFLTPRRCSKSTRTCPSSKS